MRDVTHPSEEATYQELVSLSSTALFRRAGQAGLSVGMDDDRHAIINQLLEVTLTLAPT